MSNLWPEISKITDEENNALVIIAEQTKYLHEMTNKKVNAVFISVSYLKDAIKLSIPDSVIGIVVNPQKANNEYVEYLLQTFKAFLKEKGKGTARDNINMATFENQKFPFPSVKEQQTIIIKLKALRSETQKLEAIYQQKLLNLEELKKSVLQKAFVGELNLTVCQ